MKIGVFVKNSYQVFDKSPSKYEKITKLKKALDKCFRMGYNGIVNSKGAADDESVALFFWILGMTQLLALIPYTKGCMKSTGLLHPFVISAVDISIRMLNDQIKEV